MKLPKQLPELLETYLVAVSLGDVATTVHIVKTYRLQAEVNPFQRHLMEVFGIGPCPILATPLAALLFIATEWHYAPGIG
ncbi:MAG: hypothetical protein MAG715_00625 [Methanonatronarchaeales archaeon]|nr:hypothetical protein [Methanonatronarchaeales archaeon]